jgi:transmembrane sensor
MTKEHIADIDAAAPITEQASLWWLALNDGNPSPDDHAAFGAWVARGPEHVAAYLEVEQLQNALRAKHLRWPDTPTEVLVRDFNLTHNVVSLSSATPLSPTRSVDRRHLYRRRLLSSVAAALVAVVIGAWMFLNAPQRFETRVGEQRSIVLNDGSLVTLNTSSVIQVKLEKDRRTILLLSGEALFKVAHEKNRPFDVIAGNAKVRVVGTQFNVDRSSGSTTVTVVEGKVSVENDSSNSLGESSDTGAVALSAGERVTVTVKGRLQPSAANLTTATAWTQRRLVFEHRPLSEVAAEFNRYNRHGIQILGPELRAQEVTGVFQANDPDSFIQFMEKIPGVRIVRDPDSTRVMEVN